MFLLTSCLGPNKDPKKAKKALKNEDYEVFLVNDSDDLESYDMDDLEAVLSAMDEDGEEMIMIFYFESSKAAKMSS